MNQVFKVNKLKLSIQKCF